MSRIWSIYNSAKAVADKVWSVMHFSKPEEGPLSEGTEIWGRHLVQDYAAGMAREIPVVEAAATDIAMAASLPTHMVTDIDAISGRNVANALTVEDIYDAFSAAMSEQETKIVIGNREFGRILREQGVA